MALRNGVSSNRLLLLPKCINLPVVSCNEGEAFLFFFKSIKKTIWEIDDWRLFLAMDRCHISNVPGTASSPTDFGKFIDFKSKKFVISPCENQTAISVKVFSLVRVSFNRRNGHLWFYLENFSVTSAHWLEDFKNFYQKSWCGRKVRTLFFSWRFGIRSLFQSYIDSIKSFYLLKDRTKNIWCKLRTNQESMTDCYNFS